MKLQTDLKLALVTAALLAIPAAHAATMSKGDYNATKSRITAQYKAERSACATRSANAKDICQEQAGAKQKVALAELEYAYSAKSADKTKVLVAKAESSYAVAKERCDDLAGDAKDVCVQEAKAAEQKALSDAEMGEKIAQARTEANQEKRDADYKVASEKCDALTGDAKSNCVEAAKAAFGKN